MVDEPATSCGHIYYHDLGRLNIPIGYQCCDIEAMNAVDGL